jgi:hypothetical protein
MSPMFSVTGNIGICPHSTARNPSRLAWKQGTLIIHMDILIFRTEYRQITAPLVCDHPFIHDPSDNGQDFAVEEKLGGEAWRTKRHCQKVAVCTTVWFACVRLQVLTDTDSVTR